MANRSWLNSRLFSGHKDCVFIDCNFIVDSTNGNGLGLRSLKGPYVQNVFMHTTVTPGAGNGNPASPALSIVNPNPASGIIVVQMQDAFTGVYTGGNSIVSPASGTPIVPTGTNLTVGNAYIITALGAMTRADWIALGVPAAVIPAIGVAFIAKAQGATSGGTSAVQSPAAAGSAVMSIETVGNSNLAANPYPITAQGFGSQFVLACRNVSGAIAAPAAGSVISLSFLMNNTSVKLQGE